MKLQVLWAPSQNGLFSVAPQRQSENFPSLVTVDPSIITISALSHSTKAEPFFLIVILTFGLSI